MRAVPFWSLDLLLAQFNGFPDLLIERTAANTAFRNGSGELVFAKPA